jgi:hypothetical protein
VVSGPLVLVVLPGDLVTLVGHGSSSSGRPISAPLGATYPMACAPIPPGTVLPTASRGDRMIVSFTFVRKQEGVSDEEFFARWTEHTQAFDLRDHPYITKNRLMMVAGHADYVGIAENHWPDLAAMVATSTFYTDTDAGREHWADLQTFMDIDASPTVIVTQEADVSETGTTITPYL